MTEQTKDLVWLETVDLREIWADESGVFTPWLAEPDNLTRLGEALGNRSGGTRYGRERGRLLGRHRRHECR